VPGIGFTSPIITNVTTDLSGTIVNTTANTQSMITGFKGVINFRHDTLLDNYMGYDFRNVKFRRWNTNVGAWSGTTTYIVGDFVEYTDGFVYKSLNAANLNNIPASVSDYWIQCLNLGWTLYWNTESTSVNGITSGTNTVDVKTFAEGVGTATYERCCRSNHFEPFKDNKYDYDSVATILTNNVFFLQNNDYYQVYSNQIAAENYGNTIGNGFDSNTIGNYFYSNTIGNNFYSNTIGNYFNSNTIGNYFNSNTIGNDFYSNTIGNSFDSNTIGNSFNSNTIGNGTAIDFTSATHVYATYNDVLYVRPDGTQMLSYISDLGVLTVVAANA
jgi:hypothetical protein